MYRLVLKGDRSERGSRDFPGVGPAQDFSQSLALGRRLEPVRENAGSIFPSSRSIDGTHPRHCENPFLHILHRDS